MKIHMNVVGGTDKTVRFEVVVNGILTGQLQMNRDDFTKFCGLVFQDSYTLATMIRTENGSVSIVGK